MTKHFFALLFFVSFSFHGFSIRLKDAAQKRVVEVTPESLGDIGSPSIRVGLKNKTSHPQHIEITPGTVFICSDGGAQNLIVIQDSVIKLNPYQRKSIDLWGMCIEPKDYCPKVGDQFSFASHVNPDLVKLTQLIADSGYYHSTAQAAIWALVKGKGAEDIYGQDISMSNTLSRFVANINGEEYKERTIPSPVPLNIVSIRTNIGFRVQKNTYYDFVMTDENDVVLNEYYKKRILYNGIYIYTTGINRVEESGKTYKLKVIDKDGLLVAQKIVDEQSLEDTMSLAKARTVIRYDIKSPIKKARLAVLDKDGKEVHYFYKDRFIPAQQKDQIIKFDYLKGVEKNFTVQLTDESGKVHLRHKVVVD